MLTTLVMLGFLLLAALLWLPSGQPREESPEEIARRNANSEAGAPIQQQRQGAPVGTAQPSPTRTSELSRLAGGTASALADGAQATPLPSRADGDPFQKPAPVAPWMRAATPQPSTNASQAPQQSAVEAAQAQPQYEQPDAPVAETVQRPSARASRQDSASSPAALVSGLSALGYRVHAALSGAGKATTLSVTGAALTRQAGTQWLSDPRTRQGLKAAGVSVVVILNGQESWTFML
ncbi:MAG: hypothetical protein LC774_14770 [Acidobacteria bacterium]|nr:hypothetical protein [Acidobacteriota bacterium]